MKFKTVTRVVKLKDRWDIHTPIYSLIDGHLMQDNNCTGSIYTLTTDQKPYPYFKSKGFFPIRNHSIFFIEDLHNLMKEYEKEVIDSKKV